MSAVETVYAAPAVHVDGPTRTPHRFGLFSVSQISSNPNPRFQNGVEWEPQQCDPAKAVSGVCFDSSTAELEWPEGFPLVTVKGVPLVEATPFAVYGWYDCSAFSHPPSEAEQRARRHLEFGEERAVEQAIHTGLYDNAPNFTSAVDLTPAGNPVPLAVGMGILEGRLGTDYGSAGVIHTPRSVVPLLPGLERAGERLTTKLGNFVAGGAGYDLAQTLDGDTATLYATSAPLIMRSEVFTLPDEMFRPARTNNDMTIYAWRIYLVGWECVTAKVTVQLPQPMPEPV